MITKIINVLSKICLVLLVFLILEMLPFIITSSWSGVILLVTVIFFYISLLLLIILKGRVNISFYVYEIITVIYCSLIYYKIYTYYLLKEILNYNQIINYCKTNYIFLSILIINLIINIIIGIFTINKKVQSK